MGIEDAPGKDLRPEYIPTYSRGGEGLERKQTVFIAGESEKAATLGASVDFAGFSPQIMSDAREIASSIESEHIEPTVVFLVGNLDMQTAEEMKRVTGAQEPIIVFVKESPQRKQRITEHFEGNVVSIHVQNISSFGVGLADHQPHMI